MQSTAYSEKSPWPEIITTASLGLVIGLLTAFFVQALLYIESKQSALNSEVWPVHVFLLPVVLVFLYYLKKRTLYFPTRVAELTTWTLDSSWHWHPFMSLFHFFGTLASHMVGASVGREGTAVLMAAGVARAFRLNWKFWGPIAMGCGFAAILGNSWIGLIFVGELIQTNWKQKIYILMSSFFATLLMQTMNVPHLISAVELNLEVGFFKKLSFILILALCCGFAMRFYKWILHATHAFFNRQTIWIKFACALVLMFVLIQPDFRRYQSLGILQLQDISKLDLGFQIPFLKLALTLFSVSLGFWGGEFVPLVYAGLHFGASLAHSFGFDLVVGALLSSFLFFAAATRLKWTSIFLIFSLLGWTWIFWVIILVQLTVGLSGSESIYRRDE